MYRILCLRCIQRKDTKFSLTVDGFMKRVNYLVSHVLSHVISHVVSEVLSHIVSHALSHVIFHVVSHVLLHGVPHFSFFFLLLISFCFPHLLKAENTENHGGV